MHINSTVEVKAPLWRWLVKRLQSAPLTQLHLVLPNGQHLLLGHEQDNVPTPTVTLQRAAAVRKVFFSGLLGWGEAYVDGDWASPDLLQVTEWALHNQSALQTLFSGSPSGRWLHNLLHRLNDNSLRGSRRNIASHYDLGNHFYEQWLDPTMSYSSALYPHDKATLQQAQQYKYDRILELSAPAHDARVLEVGCGWGGFAERLLRFYPNADYHGITLSQEQLLWSRERLAKRKLDKTAVVSLTDYRQVKGQYDRIVSIEMLEAVGEKHWPTYFNTLYDHLKPGGNAVIQVITIAPDRFEYYRTHADFIQRYIFPGGMLLTPEIVQQQAEKAGLTLDYAQAFGQDYATTLAAWRDNFEAAWPTIAPQGFDERFKRLWRYYLCYCESGFRHERINVYLFRLHKPA
ncbi:hypothetical protein BTE48_14780 [Oceanospirillum multiglobuliferum]|uniref:SAM-dependent methyltransferase n=1 Tax=Oceanospirillum multiglobuliferum TaxID=64969 RepID=A0A1V4T331_9GAMM|nr:hypothetical protein BTE48_14780 [Oceanospirillum multiglobuliferum]